jgi:predicted ester cyclase
MIKYQIIKEKIVNAWPMVDQLAVFEQVGVIYKPG